MRYWDSSALVPVLWRELATDAVLMALDEDPSIVTWWGTSTECMSAMARREREGSMTDAMMTDGVRRLVVAASAWEIVEPGDRVRRTAGRLLRTHELRAPDALQLAAALVACEDDPSSLAFITLDRRLALAATREGFVVVEPGGG